MRCHIWNWDHPRRSKTWVGCRAGSGIPSVGPDPWDSLSSPGRPAAPGVPMAVPGSRLPAETASEERGLLPQKSRGPSCWYPSGGARPPVLGCRHHPSLGGWLRCCHITPVSRRWELKSRPSWPYLLAVSGWQEPPAPQDPTRKLPVQQAGNQGVCQAYPDLCAARIHPRTGLT